MNSERKQLQFEDLMKLIETLRMFNKQLALCGKEK